MVRQLPPFTRLATNTRPGASRAQCSRRSVRRSGKARRASVERSTVLPSGRASTAADTQPPTRMSRYRATLLAHLAGAPVEEGAHAALGGVVALRDGRHQ